MNALARSVRMLPHVIVAALAIAALGAIALAHRYSPEQLSHLADVFVHSLHGPGFVVVAVFVFAILRIYRRSAVNYVHAAIVSMAIGLFAEAAQIPGPRDAEISDLIVDAIGIIGSLGSIALFDRDVRSMLNDRLMLGLGLVSIGALTISFAPTAWYGYAWFSQHRAMPTLISFENRWESTVISQPRGRRPERIDAPANWPTTGTIAYAEESGRYGILIRLTPYTDWSEYSTLSFVAASANNVTQKIAVSIRDMRLEGERRNNRYSQRLYVDPEPQRYVIALDKVRDVANERPFDIAHVESFILSAADPGSGTKLFFDDFRLE